MTTKNKLLALLALVLAGVFLYSGWVLLRYRQDSRQQQQQHEQLRQLLRQPEQTGTAQQTPGEQEQAGEEGGIPREFSALYALNPDFVGWISVEGTRVDYPVVQKRDVKDYYLRRGLDRKRANHGTVYAWEQADVLAPSDNVTLFGHRMNDGTMFYDLLNYAKESYWQAHPTFRFHTLAGEGEYRIFAAFRTSGTGGRGLDYHTFVNADSPESFDAFVDQCKALSFYDTGIVPRYGDKLVTLSTCDYALENGRMVVIGVKAG